MHSIALCKLVYDTARFDKGPNRVIQDIVPKRGWSSYSETPLGRRPLGSGSQAEDYDMDSIFVVWSAECATIASVKDTDQVRDRGDDLPG